MKNALILTGWLILTALIVVPRGAAGEPAGKVCVMTGDTVMIGGKRRHTKCEGGRVVKFWGVAAFKMTQRCAHPSGRDVMCGLYSAAMLQEKIKTADIRCDEKATTDEGIVVGECFLGEENLNRYMVEKGFALADRAETERFTGYEAKAKAGKKGLWVTRFAMPWDVKDQ